MLIFLLQLWKLLAWEDMRKKVYFMALDQKIEKS